MNLLQPARELLEELYQHYQQTGDVDIQLTYSDEPLEKKRDIQNVRQLVLAGFIEETGSATGFTLLRLTKLGIEYFEEVPSPQPQVVNNFNVAGNVENSILGNQASASVHVGSDLAQVEALISAITSPDRELLESLPKELSKLQAEKELKPGCLAKFNGILNKYPKLFDAVGSILTKLVLGCL